VVGPQRRQGGVRLGYSRFHCSTVVEQAFMDGSGPPLRRFGDALGELDGFRA
jgi:hypothetical protein